MIYHIASRHYVQLLYHTVESDTVNLVTVERGSVYVWQDMGLPPIMSEGVAREGAGGNDNLLRHKHDLKN